MARRLFNTLLFALGFAALFYGLMVIIAAAATYSRYVLPGGDPKPSLATDVFLRAQHVAREGVLHGLLIVIVGLGLLFILDRLVKLHAVLAARKKRPDQG